MNQYKSLQISPYATAAAAASTPAHAMAGVGYHHNPLTFATTAAPTSVATTAAPISVQNLLLRTAIAGNQSPNPALTAHAYETHTINSQQQQLLANNLVMTQKVNEVLHQQLTSKTNEATDLKLRCIAERRSGMYAAQNDSILKDAIDQLEAKNRVHVREINRLQKLLESFIKDKTEANKQPPQPPIKQISCNAKDMYHGQTAHLAQYQTKTNSERLFDQKGDFSLRSWMLQNKIGCPLCLTKDHTLMNCWMLRSSGFVVTYHPRLDKTKLPQPCEQASKYASAVTASHTNKRNLNQCFSNPHHAVAAATCMNVQTFKSDAAFAPKEAEAATLWSTLSQPLKASPNGSDSQASGIQNPTIKPPAREAASAVAKQTHCQEVIELSSDSESGSENENENQNKNKNENQNQNQNENEINRNEDKNKNEDEDEDESGDESEQDERLCNMRNNRGAARNITGHDKCYDNDDRDDAHSIEGASSRNDEDTEDDDGEEEDEDSSTISGSAENDDVVADAPTSSTLDYQQQETSEYARSSSNEIDYDRGGKDRPISIDICEEAEEGEQEMIEKATDQATAPLQAIPQQELGKRQGLPKGKGDNNSMMDVDEKYSDGDCDSDEEIKIVGETGKNPLSDFAHPRYDCVIKPFARDPFAFCVNCYCYVCDVKTSECEHWKLSGDEEKESHCYADSKIEKWKRRRSRLRNKRKRPERVLKNIAIYLQDTVQTKLPSKRRKRSTIRYGQAGYESNSDVQRALRNPRKRKST